ncbi:MAG: FAD-dependent oxidoreductase [Methylococcales bacterium]|nr:FAD-dependent oxidoreductase [Methylococcales bacterium]
MEIDYLIVGQGLAGSLLGWTLIQQHKKVVIVDTGEENASLVAAGLINPVTGMRFVKSAEVDVLLPFALTCYQALSDYFQQPFFIEKPMLRLLKNKKELEACQKRLIQIAYQPYLSKIISSYQALYAPFGLLTQQKTGYLLTRSLLGALKTYFIDQQIYVKEALNYQDIRLSPSLQWKSFKPKQIIFCEGHLATQNPWFSWLPFQLVKGEIITANTQMKTTHHILNYGQWFIPLSDYQFRTGATFDREHLDQQCTEKAKESLLQSLEKVYPSLKIDRMMKQQAGIRPTTKDKQPFIGRHPLYPHIMIFNGFGAKGSLQIPWYSRCLANYLVNNTPIPPLVDIKRYRSDVE